MTLKDLRNRLLLVKLEDIQHRGDALILLFEGGVELKVEPRSAYESILISIREPGEWEVVN